MALEVEDGSGKTNSESYASVTHADDYHTDHGNTLWFTMSTTEKEQALRRATDYITQTYRSRWAGTRVTTTQALDWPRYGVVIDLITSIESTIVPHDIRHACIDLAFKAAGGDLIPDITQSAIRKKVGDIEIEYDKLSPQRPVYLEIDSILAPYLNGFTSGINSRLVRS
jgi:hypothetical protein